MSVFNKLNLFGSRQSQTQAQAGNSLNLRQSGTKGAELTSDSNSPTFIELSTYDFETTMSLISQLRTEIKQLSEALQLPATPGTQLVKMESICSNLENTLAKYKTNDDSLELLNEIDKDNDNKESSDGTNNSKTDDKSKNGRKSSKDIKSSKNDKNDKSSKNDKNDKNSKKQRKSSKDIKSKNKDKDSNSGSKAPKRQLSDLFDFGNKNNKNSNKNHSNNNNNNNNSRIQVQWTAHQKQVSMSGDDLDDDNDLFTISESPHGNGVTSMHQISQQSESSIIGSIDHSSTAPNNSKNLNLINNNSNTQGSINHPIKNETELNEEDTPLFPGLTHQDSFDLMAMVSNNDNFGNNSDLLKQHVQKISTNDLWNYLTNEQKSVLNSQGVPTNSSPVPSQSPHSQQFAHFPQFQKGNNKNRGVISNKVLKNTNKNGKDNNNNNNKIAIDIDTGFNDNNDNNLLNNNNNVLTKNEQKKATKLAEQRYNEIKARMEIEDKERQDRMDAFDKHNDRLNNWEFDSKNVRRGLRTLITSLQNILWHDTTWKTVTLANLINQNQCKKQYRLAVRLVHPDRSKNRGDSTERTAICERIFEALNAAWHDEFGKK